MFPQTVETEAKFCRIMEVTNVYFSLIFTLTVVSSYLN